jgi:DNA-binding XRE family transcriptional regulator
MHPFETYRRRQEPPMTQAALGKLLGVTRACISLIEAGKRRPGVDLMVLAAARTGIPPARLRPDMVGVLKRARTRDQ